MKTKFIFSVVLLMIISWSCSNNVEFTEAFKKQAAGKYLYTQDETMEVYFDDDKLALKWRGADDVKPVVTDENTIFIADMYKKLRFVEHPETKAFYLATVDPDNEEKVTYDYIKVADSFKTPSEYLKDKNFEMALEGYANIRAQDSNSNLVEEYRFNRLGYRYIRDGDYDNAIAVFKMNTELFPTSSNVYDSLADAYKRSGDSAQAYFFYKKTLELDSGNERAKAFIKNYNPQGE